MLSVRDCTYRVPRIRFCFQSSLTHQRHTRPIQPARVLPFSIDSDAPCDSPQRNRPVHDQTPQLLPLDFRLFGHVKPREQLYPMEFPGSIIQNRTVNEVMCFFERWMWARCEGPSRRSYDVWTELHTRWRSWDIHGLLGLLCLPLRGTTIAQLD